MFFLTNREWYYDDPKKNPVPLCWTDQITKSDMKILKPSEPKEEKTKPVSKSLQLMYTLT